MAIIKLNPRKMWIAKHKSHEPKPPPGSNTILRINLSGIG